MISNFVLCLVLAFSTGPDLAARTTTSSGLHLNARHLRTGRYLYRTVVRGENVGTSQISIRRSSSMFVYRNRVTGEFSQDWRAVARVGFEPVSALLKFGEGHKRRTAFQLQYKNGRVKGFVMRRNGSSELAAKIEIDRDLPSDTVDQRIDWAAVISQVDLLPEREFAFQVFDPVSGISRLTGRIVGIETTHVPAGDFQTMRVSYRIDKPKGPETYQVLTTVGTPRMLVKEEFPDGAVTELVDAHALP